MFTATATATTSEDEPAQIVANYLQCVALGRIKEDLKPNCRFHWYSGNSPRNPVMIDEFLRFHISPQYTHQSFHNTSRLLDAAQIQEIRKRYNINGGSHRQRTVSRNHGATKPEESNIRQRAGSFSETAITTTTTTATNVINDEPTNNTTAVLIVENEPDDELLTVTVTNNAWSNRTDISLSNDEITHDEYTPPPSAKKSNMYSMERHIVAGNRVTPTNANTTITTTTTVNSSSSNSSTKHNFEETLHFVQTFGELHKRSVNDTVGEDGIIKVRLILGYTHCQTNAITLTEYALIVYERVDDAGNTLSRARLNLHASLEAAAAAAAAMNSASNEIEAISEQQSPMVNLETQSQLSIMLRTPQSPNAHVEQSRMQIKTPASEEHANIRKRRLANQHDPSEKVAHKRKVMRRLRL